MAEMDMKEKLVELLTDCEAKGFWSYGTDRRTGEHGGHEMTAEYIASYLIENCVTVQENCKACAEATQNCIVKLQEQIAELRSVQGWISVKDRLPEESGEYLAYCGEYDGICVLYYEVLKTKGKWRTKWKDDVTHWMPLPQPPKGE